MTSQSPRVYTYKITFEEVPYYYYGVHKEKVFNEEYWGSPKTNKWCWELYTPKKQILEFFEFSDEGYLEANLVEDRLIRPVLNNEWCLNESCGGVRSLKILREKSGVFLKKWVEENGNPGPEALKKYLKENPDHQSKSGKLLYIKNPNHFEKSLGKYLNENPEHQSVSAKKCFEKNPNHFNETLGKYMKENPNHQKNAALKSAQSKWMDLDHPELGAHHFNKLIGLQRRYGFPSSRENRVRVS
jgi:hypothetical protein